MDQTTSSELQQYTGSLIARANNWADLSDADLRREGTRAANERDAERLWSLTEAFLVLHNKSGSRVSPHTLSMYKTGVRQLLEAWSGQNLLRPARDAALQFVRHLEQRGLSSGSISARLSAARVLYRALRWAGVTDASPFADVKAPADPTPPEEKRRAYPEAHVHRLLESAGTVDRTLVLLAAHGGLRIAEALSLSWRDVNLTAGTLKVRQGKGRRDRTVHLSDALRGTLTALQAESDPDGPVLPYRTATRARQRLKRVCEQAGVPYLGVHSLRHSCGTRLYRITNDLRVAARHLGHSSTTTTAIYAKMDTRAYADAIRKL